MPAMLPRGLKMPKVEKALYATALKQIKNAKGYSRVYFGAEFCQWRLPAPAAALRALYISSGLGMKLTLLTPWLTDTGMKKAKAILGKLAGAGALDVEVVVNDFGLLAVLKDEFPMFVPVLGPSPCKAETLPEGAEYNRWVARFGACVIYASRYRGPGDRFVSQEPWNKRVELDSPLQGIEADLKPLGLKGTIYTPYAYVTTTRHCPASFDGKSWQAFTGCKIKGCLKNVIELDNPAHEKGILMRGNTQFVENAVLPEGLAGMGIDRIVHMEELP